MKRIAIVVLINLTVLGTQAQSTDGMEEVFSDDFRNNKNGWFTSMSGSNRSKVNNDKQFLAIDVNDNGSVERSWAATTIDFNQDFVLKAQIKSETEKGAKDETYYGFMIGLSSIKYKNEQGWYGFRLYSDIRKARIYATNEDGTEFFKREVEKPSSYTPSDYNEISIERKNGKMTFYLNGTEIYTNDATTTASGTIVFEARNNQLAYLKKIEIYQ